MNPNVLNALKIAGAAAGVGIAGFGVHKAVEHFKGNQEAQDTETPEAQAIAEVPSDSPTEAPSFQELSATQLTEYPQFVGSAFPNLEIREGSVFELDGKDYMLIEGTDTKFEDTPRPQAILFVLDDSNYRMISSVTVKGDKVSYGHKDDSCPVYIGYLNGGNVQSFKGSSSDVTIENFSNDFVITQ
jgi:hypothetical protein